MKFRAPLKRLSCLLASSLALCAGLSAEAQNSAKPLPFDEAWKVFLAVDAPKSFELAPESLSSPDGKAVAPKTAKLKGASIDLAALGGTFHEKDVAVLYNEFVSDSSYEMPLGVSADYWMEAHMNGKLVFSTMAEGNGVNTYKPEDHVFKLPVKAGRNLFAVKVLSGSEGWRFVCGVPSAIPLPNLKFTESSEWKAVDMSDIQVKAGSALDLSSLSALPLDSGKRLLRLTAGASGKLVAEGRPDSPVRLKGYTFPGSLVMGLWGVPALGKEDVDSIVRLSRIQGYNLVRFYEVDAMSPKQDMAIQPEVLDRADYLMSQLGKQGVYVHLALTAYNNFLKWTPETWASRNKFKVRMYLGDPLVRQAWAYGMETVMNHVNPYNGLAWKDDPAIACVEFYNEQEWGLMRLDESFPPEIRAAFDARFRLWLAAKYNTPEALAKAWGDASLSSFEQATAFPKGSGAKERDFLLLCDELSRECFDWYEATLRKTGYKGLTSQYTIPFWLGDNLVRFEKSQVAIANMYYSHPEGKPVAKCPWGSKCQQDSSVGGAAGYWRNANAWRFAGRPFFVTEFNHAFWNKYQHECGLLFGAYSALQGFDALIIHDRRSMLKASAPTDSFNVDSNPVARANEFLAACLYLRKDVKSSPRRVELEIPQSSLGSLKAVSGEQSKIGLLSGFSVSFPGAKPPQGVGSPGKADMVITPSSGSEVKVGEWAGEVLAGKDAKFSLDSFVAEMKAKGLLPKSNVTAPSKGVFQSDTGEITMRAKENLLKVAASHSEAVTLEGGKGEPVGQLSVVSTGVPALVAACSADGKALADSKRIVLLYSTDVVNTDMELSGDRVGMINIGKLPVLMQTGKLEATLRNSNGAKMSLYALGLDGSRRERLPLAFEDGLLKIKLDTAVLKNGPTPFFELTDE